jgi:type IV pilus assembly protein PilX
VTANKQRGVVLIVALVMLLVVTLLGVAVMSGASLDMKMTNNSQERQQAFNAAEAALSQAEAYLMSSTAPALTSYASSCAGGLCFFGTNAGTPGVCNVIPASNVIPSDPWTAASGLNVWSGTTKNMTATTISSDIAVTAKYIIEFRCYVPDLENGTTNGNALYRITARGYSVAGNAEVMLQSTFRKSL